MNTDINIEDGSIILSYSFIYDEDTVKKINVDENELPKIENLLSYTDRLFANNKIKKYDKETVFLYFKETIYKLKIDDMNILFFENKIAILYIKLLSKDFSNLKKLYNINKALTNFYTKKNDSYLYIGEENPSEIKLPIKEFETKIQGMQEEKIIDAPCSDIITALKETEILKNKVIYENDAIKIKKIQNDNELKIYTTIKKYNKFTKTFSEGHHLFYNPHDEDKKAYPINDAYKKFKGRVGFSCDEQNKITEQNKEFDLDKECNRHYLYFDNQKILTEKKRKKEHIFDFIHYDTFITSLIMEYVKPNEGFQYYDTFNPGATSYINSYITLKCDSEVINKEYTNNFVSFEPILSSKTSKGKKITNPDFFNIYQSQADIFTIGNSHNIVHIIDKDVDSNMKTNKEKDHFFVYLLTSMQRSFILNIINSSIVNINNLEKNNFNPSKIRKTYQKLSDALDDYNSYLTNVNFKVISNNSSVDSSYSFFRKCNEIDKLTSQWDIVSLKFNGWKSILSHVLNKHPTIFILTIVTFGLVIKLANTGVNALLEYFGF